MIFRRQLRRVEARGRASGDRISGFSSREAEEHVCGVGFDRRRLDVHGSEIDVTGLLEFVDLGHSSEPWRLRDAVESRSSRQAYVTSDRVLGTRAAMTASSSTDLQNLKFWASTELTRAFTRLPSFRLLRHAPATPPRAFHSPENSC